MKTGPAFPLTRPSIFQRIVEACRALRDYFCTDYDGVGGYAKNSHKIPASGWIGGALFCVGFFALCWIGTGVGF